MRFTAAYTLASGVIMIPPEVNGAQIYVFIVKQLSARQLVAVAAGEDAMNRYEDTVTYSREANCQRDALKAGWPAPASERR